MTFFEELKWRGLIKDMTNNEDFEEKLNKGGMIFYWGTDPTADSLHIGHYSSLLMAKRLMLHGHKPILLIGGSTGMIGDPRPTAEREIIDKEEVFKNAECLKKQVASIVGEDVEFVNNYDWTKDVTFLDFLRDIGKYINVNYMLSKDIIKRRLDTGITYAEFSYTLLQAFDFLKLFESKNCELQIGGSDQWGNLTSGVELIGKKLGKEAYAFTMPLILDATGNKFGKSEGNALWLDINKTSGYDIYQYLINSSDEKVEEYLKVFTFLSREEIEDIIKKHKEKPEDRLAQKTLAYEFVKDLHGTEEADAAKNKSEALFGKMDTDSLEIEEIEAKVGSNILDVLVSAGITPSKSEGRRLVTQGGISVDSEKILDPNFIVENEVVVIQKGKKVFKKVKLTK